MSFKEKAKAALGLGLLIGIPYFMVFFLSEFYSQIPQVIDTVFKEIRLILGILLLTLWLIFCISMFIKSKTTK